ncbi:hypothetical protein [Arthrobacter sp. MAHUQ-56]
MDIIAAVIVIALFLAAATAAALLRDNRGQTPPAAPYEGWSALDPPSSSYTLRIF